MSTGVIVDGEAMVAAFDVLTAAIETINGFDKQMLRTPERLAMLRRYEQAQRQLSAGQHPLINGLAQDATPAELGGTLSHAIADATLISRADAGRRVREAADLGERRALTGEPLPPVLAATATAQRAGKLGREHVAVIRRFYHQLPGWIDIETRTAAEADLARLATQYRPDQLIGFAEHVMNCLNPDGNFTDDDRAHRRGVTLGNQQADGMSALSGWLTPPSPRLAGGRAGQIRRPGICNPTTTPLRRRRTVPGRDRSRPRSAAQRHHDGLNAALRAVLASGELGQHNGLPASIIVSTTLTELEAAAGHGLTGGGTRLPISDVIRLARHAHHYLAIFDQGQPVALYHTKRLASPGQRIVLYAKDRGCTVGGYYCEIHHITDYATCHTTNIDNLTLACGTHHRLLQPHGWTTRKHPNGTTEWIPPPHLDKGQPRTNTYHHPNKLLHNPDDDEK
ncbi:hypothetical protein MSTO_27000 [Mycobacterium stomatepiae]|uniref:HNH nuclease domain-containing protein n=1 Tax=Mycobacterium stomatepiae TaxID=470076 RepID=A0A7I7Q870_9MYCO|nr:HNH endonuclease signature motif containing protein [Mycobacterium stomatepiae]BBY22495.1 hypothetical protein MSTO_27000 [Mycobacterium stomatepiae]